MKKEYPMDSEVPSNLQGKITLSNRPTVGCIKYSGTYKNILSVAQYITEKFRLLVFLISHCKSLPC